jgi:hypothetical protein
MKASLKVIIYIILVTIITLILCSLFIKSKTLNFKITNEFQKVQKNKKNIEEIIVRSETLMGKFCYKLDIDKAYDILSNIYIKSEAKMTCTDSDKYLEVYFKDGTNEEFFFECENLVYNGIRYELKDKVMLFNKDEYVPDKITKGMIIVSNEDRVECKQ